ncbi:chymotrypsin-1-like [Anopheles stephensi]|uniref:chymotrypsin-1-like n=1 Tax=Anopheles stephensi TaxID=30069 RepID=UPI0016588938|nr:chymotrypsin-1-like [Anopheles stephensi]
MDRKVRVVSILLGVFVLFCNGESLGAGMLVERTQDGVIQAQESNVNSFPIEDIAGEEDTMRVLAKAFNPESVNPFLVGGGPATVGAYPAQVAIQIGATTFCGGTILNQNHILTAAGCVLDANNNLIAANQFTVRAGVLTVDQNAPALAVNRIFPHPHYNPWTFENDIAVLRLTNNIVFPQVATPNMAPAELNHRIVRDAETCQVLGWNWLPTAQNVPLQVLNVMFSPRASCISQHQGLLRDSMVCTETTATAHGVCAANRGGGLYCNDLLTGVISFGFGCGTNNTYTVYTQVRYFHHWIQQQFIRTDTPVAGPTPMPGVVGGGGGDASTVSLSVATVIVAIVSALFLS